MAACGDGSGTLNKDRNFLSEEWVMIVPNPGNNIHAEFVGCRLLRFAKPRCPLGILPMSQANGASFAALFRILMSQSIISNRSFDRMSFS